MLETLYAIENYQLYVLIAQVILISLLLFFGRHANSTLISILIAGVAVLGSFLKQQGFDLKIVNLIISIFISIGIAILSYRLSSTNADSTSRFSYIIKFWIIYLLITAGVYVFCKLLLPSIPVLY